MPLSIETITVDAMGSLPSLGVLMGTGISSSVFDAINGDGHRSFFGSDFDHISQDFFNRHVSSMSQINAEISRTVNKLMNPDRFRPLTMVSDYESIPPCMEIPILMFEPIRKLFNEGRVDGFGYIPESLPEEDTYGRLLDNMNCYDVEAAMDADGGFELSGTYYSDDPDIDDDGLFAIRKTRDYIRDHLLEYTDRDPTAIDLMRG